MNRVGLVMLVSVLVLGAMFWSLSSSETNSASKSGGSNDAQPVAVFCAASNRAVMEAIKADYEKETGRRIEIQYGPSQTLLSSIEVSGSGDLYLPADESYLTMAQEKGLVLETLPLANMQGVVAVRKGNPQSITTFDHLLKDGMRLVQAGPDAAAIGKVTRRVLTEQGLWKKLEQGTTSFRGTVTEVANDVVIDAADAGIVYDAVLHTYPDLEFVELPELANTGSQIAVGVIAGSQQPQNALHFARYLAAEDRGLKRYAEFGFRPGEGDDWADVPELSVFAGSMLRPAIDETITAFEEREGVRVNRVYNGCGILVTQMQAGQHPDAYFACDVEFMTQMRELFPDPVVVSQNELVILVQKDNPLDITSLKDLSKENVRVGIGHEKKCAMGWLTQNTLREGGIQQDVMANVAVESATGDLLVNQMLTGSLDAAIVYLSNAAGSGDKLDALRINGMPCSIAVQPFAVAKESQNQQLAQRLFQRLRTKESRKTFEDEGFSWGLER